MSPDDVATAARARVGRLEAALEVLGSDIPEAQPSKALLTKAQEQTRVLPIGERMDSTLKFSERSKARIEKQQAELSREQDLLQQVRIWSGFERKPPSVWPSTPVGNHMRNRCMWKTSTRSD